MTLALYDPIIAIPAVWYWFAGALGLITALAVMVASWISSDGDEIFLTAVMALLLGGAAFVIPIAIVSTYAEGALWEKYLVDHRCAPIGRVSGGTSVGVGTSSSGQAVVVTTALPDKMGYRCANGEEYWR